MSGRARLANDAWESLLTVHAAFMKDFAAADIWGDISMKEYDVLYTLAKVADPVRLTDLHGRVLLSQPALSRMVDRLEARGLVDRCDDPGDRRAVRIALTEAGRERQREVGLAHARDVALAMTARVSDADLEELTRITRALLK
ncbi:MAG TPA: MarR family transcriptional regulator [Pseudolysinimonas sp.]|nr:MarR family transcriptional regulator [Pseudolysinimonas sp.]